jgi:pyridoxal phosphate enzyme (YggS family)
MDDLNQIIYRNYSQIQSRIAAACLRVERNPDTVRLIAVTKYAQLDWVQALFELGCRDLGESRTPQLEERATLLSPEIRWHFIGPLQRNKVRRTIQHCSLIHSVDSLKLLQTIDRIAGESELQQEVLLEVNLAGESNKKGFTREALCAEWDALCQVSHVTVTGLMTMAPHVGDPELARPVFRELRELRDELLERSPEHLSLHELSMGMSGDFEVGIEEGATLVRVGSALYEGLESSQEN